MVINNNEKYLKGYWKHEAIGFVIDAKVFDHLLGIHFSEVQQLLSEMNILPETYCQKWFTSLCIHVLSFESVFDFVEQLFKEGYQFLFRFGLSVIKTLEKQILEARNHEKIYKLLRFEDITVENLGSEIIKGASSFQFSSINFSLLRQQLYKEKVKPSLDAADAFRKKQEEEDKNDPEIEGECPLCHMSVSEFWCFDCKKAICEGCKDEPEDDSPHDPDTHKVIPLEEYEGEEGKNFKTREEEEEEEEDINARISQLKINGKSS